MTPCDPNCTYEVVTLVEVWSSRPRLCQALPRARVVTPAGTRGVLKLVRSALDPDWWDYHIELANESEVVVRDKGAVHIFRVLTPLELLAMEAE